MELTESEAKKFWPVYEDYQKDLQKINERLLNMLQSYAAAYRSKSLTDEKAKKLLDEWIALEQAEVKQRSAFTSQGVESSASKESSALSADRKRVPHAAQVRSRGHRAVGSIGVTREDQSPVTSYQ